MTTEETPFVPPVTNEEAIEFLENACRNWAEFPVLSPPDIEDVAKSLTRFVRAAINRAEGHSLSQHCPNCEAQAAEIEKLRDALEIAIVLVAAELPYAPMLQHLRATLADAKARAAMGEKK